MNRIKILIAAGIMTFTSNAKAIDIATTTPVVPSVSDTKTTVVQQDLDDKNLNETIAKFESLVKDVMSSESPSCLKAGGVATVRVLVKLIGMFMIKTLVKKYGFEKYSLNVGSGNYEFDIAPTISTIVFTILGVSAILLSDRFIKTDDLLLCKLKNLEQYTFKLSIQEKSVISTQIKEKYSKSLSDLLIQQNRSSDMNAGQYISLGIELILLIIAYQMCCEGSYNPFYKFNDPDDVENSNNVLKLTILITALDNIYQMINRIRTNPAYEKDKVFAEIQKALAYDA